MFKTVSTTSETRYYLRSFTGSKRFGETPRSHWGVENNLHWVLDVTFRGDDCPVRVDHAPKNFSVVRELALLLLPISTWHHGFRISMQSRIAPHSIVEPLAMAKKHAQSFTPTFPNASAIFNGIDNAACLN